MKTALFLSFFVSILTWSCAPGLNAQNGPKLIQEGDDEYGDYVVEWRYMSYAFVSSTPPIARPITTYEIKKYQRGEFRRLDNEVVFASNLTEITQRVNAKLKTDYLVQQKTDPSCFPKFVPVRLNDVGIRVDESTIYFEVVWNSEAVGDAFADCYFPKSVVSFPFKEFEQYFNR